MDGLNSQIEERERKKKSLNWELLLEKPPRLKNREKINGKK